MGLTGTGSRDAAMPRNGPAGGKGNGVGRVAPARDEESLGGGVVEENLDRFVVVEPRDAQSRRS